MKKFRHNTFGIVILVLICAVVAGFVYTARHKSALSSSAPTNTTTNPAAYLPTAGKPGTNTIKVLVNHNKIVGSKTLNVNKNDAVYIEFMGGDDQEEGDINIEGYDLTVPTTKNYKTSLEFKATKAGSFPIKLTYEEEAREEAEQRGEVLGSQPDTELYTTSLGTFIVK